MRRVRRKGGNKEKVFGCDLLEHLNASSQEIPLVLRSCSEFVETHGIVDGIYRLSGVSSNIQKLRGEFESDGSPELNKDLYLQDIHCVSSLCKAYFRELPNPLLTYQLYDKFAEAVAIQLEEERLVKIRDVLKELPRPHYRTLEFLMRHLVRMASYSSETNMHARNLAIVWAPNLLRSKDIEASGFNGTAAFMEVRVQSIVVEFILTHVPQLFPEAGDSNERRKSLPSPSAACVPEESFFRSQPVPNFGNISPGDGPLAIRPYHAIIEGTDKRKGSLKGRKWMSIFNIGGRFPDPRRRQKHSAKEKERQVLRPARSMDSLSTPPYPNEGCRRSAQRPPSNNIPTASPLVTSSPKPGLDVTVSTGALGGSEYAVTYRRGTGLVSGGTQGTYTALDPEGLGLTGNETLQSRSPGVSTKVGRRAAMHITGPTMVTVPLHITSNLALGVLQGGGADRIIHRGRDKDGGDRVDGKEGGEKVERRESRVTEKKVEESRQVEEEEEQEEEINHREKVLDAEETTVPDDGGEEGGEEKKEDEEELVTGGRGVSRERVRSLSTTNTDEDNEEDAVISDYMDMKGVQPFDFQPEVTDHGDDGVYDSFNVLHSTEVEGDDLVLSGYVQDNFDFLDQMDCSAMDHMDCSVPCQVNEFSVEPPGHSDDEYEVMEQAQTSCHPAEVQTHLQPDPETRTRSQTELNPHRPLSLDINSRHTKSLSLPYMTSPVHRPEDSSSEGEVEGDDSDENYYSSDDDNDSMFVKSLPSDFFLSNLPEFKPDADEQDCCAHDGVPACQLQSCEERECRSQNHEFPACDSSHAGDEEQIQVNDKVDEDGLEEKEITKTEEEDNVYQEGDRLENNKQSKATEEDCSVMEDTQSDKEQRIASEASTHCCTEFPLLSDDESSTMTYTTVEEEKEVVDNPYRDYLPCYAVSSVTQRESADVLLEESRDFSAGATEQPRICVREDAIEKDSDEGDGWRVCKEIEDMCQEMGLEMKEDDWEVCEETTEEDIKPEEAMQEVGKEQDSAICGTSNDICDELEDEEQEQVEKKGARESVVREGDGMEDVKVAEEEEEEEKEKEEEEEQLEKVSGEEIVEDGEGGTKEAEVRIEVVEDSMETSEEKLTDTEMQQEFEEKETNLPNTSEQDEAIQRQHAMNDKTQQLHREEVVSKEIENSDERAGEHNTKPSVDKQVKEVRSDKKEFKEGRKYEENDSSRGGVGRKLVVSKNPKVYQVKAVPVVPPKPQHCKITALTLRQQQQQRERRDAGAVGTTLRVPAEQDKVSAGEQGKDGDRDGERERRRDGDEGATSRNSPLSMCFDEAVAIATMRREKEKGCEKEKEKERQRDWGNEVQ